MNDDTKPTFADVCESNGVKMTIMATLTPEALEKQAAEFVSQRHLAPEKVAAMAEEARKVIAALLKATREEDRKRTRAKYDKAGAAALFASSQRVVDALELYRDQLLDWEEETGDIPVLDESACKDLGKMLSATTLLIYPCWRLDEKLSPNAIVYLMRPLLKDGQLRQEVDLEALRAFTDHGIFCEREVTEEFNRQDRLFQLIHQLAYASAAKLKELGERDLAIRWIRLLRHADRHAEVYTYNFIPEEATTFVSELFACSRETGLALEYAALASTDEIRKETV